MNDITLAVLDGRVTTTSNQIAEHFGKEHKNVLRAIDNLDCSDDFRRLNFEPTDYIDKNFDSQRSCNLTRDGFVFLCMGFTGKAAARWKEKYIAAFNAMEAELRGLQVGAGGTALHALHPGERINRALNQHINRTAYATAMARYAPLRQHLTELAQETLASGASQIEAMHMVTDLASQADESLRLLSPDPENPS